MKFNLDDLKRMRNIFDDLIERADALLAIEDDIKGVRPHARFSAYGITEIDNDEIEFRCENRIDDVETRTFTFEQLLDENYIEKRKEEQRQKEEAERIQKEQEKALRAAQTEKRERETLRQLKEKYPDEVI